MSFLFPQALFFQQSFEYIWIPRRTVSAAAGWFILPSDCQIVIDQTSAVAENKDLHRELFYLLYFCAREDEGFFSRVTWDSVKSAGPSEKTAFVVFERFEFGGVLIFKFYFYRYLKLPWLIRRKAGRKVSSAFCLEDAKTTRRSSRL
jgi:hypothetical protein